MVRKISVILVLLLFLPIFLPFFSSNVDAAWWNSSWAYRKKMTIINAIPDYQVKIVVYKNNGYDNPSAGTIDTEGHCKNDFGDIRFANETNELPYWIEEKVDGSYAVVWVKLPSDITNYNYIYIYYGNSSTTSTSNGDATFELFDHFEGSTLNTNKWVVTGSYSISNSEITLTGTSSSYAYIRSLQSFGTGYALRTKYKYTYLESYGSSNVGFQLYIYIRQAGDQTNICLTVSNHITASSIHKQINTYHVFDLIRTTSQTKMLIDNANEVTTSEAPTTSYYVEAYADGVLPSFLATTVVDWIAVRKYASPEPTWGNFGNEESSLPVVVTNQPTEVGEIGASLHGYLQDDGGENCSVWFEWGTTPSYGYTTPIETNKRSPYEFSYYLYYLSPGTLYHYRAAARNPAGTSYGSDVAFLTKPNLPHNFRRTIYYHQLNLTWTKGEGASRTVIVRKIGWYPSNINDGVVVYNDTGTSYIDTGLNPYTTYYYRAWSYVSSGGLQQYSAISVMTCGTPTNYLPNFLSYSVTVYGFGFSQTTTFTFNVTIKDIDDSTLQDVRLKIWSGNELNCSMSWVSGANATGANYTVSLILPHGGIWNYQFLAYDGWNWNCSSIYELPVYVDVSFNFNMPTYLDVGDYIISYGCIKDKEGNPLSNIWVRTRILDSNYNVVPFSEMDFYASNGLYQYVFSTSTMIPGIYYIVVNYTYNGTTYVSETVLYLSTPGGGHRVTNIHFAFYNVRTGVGIEPSSFKIYVSTDTTFDSSDRIYYNTYYNAYTGQTLYYKVLDYFDNQIYPRDVDYKTIYVNKPDMFVDIPIDWNAFSVKNMNSSIVKIIITNGSKSLSQYIFPYEAYYYYLLDGEYNITLVYYNSVDGSYQTTKRFNMTITTDSYYWIRGYDLKDIIIQVTATNSTISSLVMNLTVKFNLTNSTIDYLNSTIWNYLVSTNTTVNNISMTIMSLWDSQNRTFLYLTNQSIIYFNFYNTNTGLGLDRKILNIYINGERFDSNSYSCRNGSVINLTVKDYYDTTLFTYNFTVNAPIVFIDLGLTYHSYKFNNMNNIYYMVSILKENATRWYERGLCPYETIEFLLPTANYIVRIYDVNYTKLANFTTFINRSKVYLIQGQNLSEVLSGQFGVIINHILELRGNFEEFTRPNIVKVGYNIPYVYVSFHSIYDNPQLNTCYVCPALVTSATVESSLTTNCTSRPPIPTSTTNNGTIVVLDDKLYFEGLPPSKIVVKDINTNEELLNASYLPSYINLDGRNVSINSSSPIEVRRVVKFQQYRKFYWLKTLTTNQYEATVNITNPTSYIWREVVVMIQLANDSTPLLNTVRVYDVENGIWLEEGLNYEVGGMFIKFWIPSLSPSFSRHFKAVYYGSSEDIVKEGIPIKEVTTYTTKTYNNKLYYYFQLQWINPNTVNYKGILTAKLNFEVPQPINPNSWKIIDVDNGRKLESDEFIYTPGSLMISEKAVGVIPPGTSRTFDCYFYLEEPIPTQQEKSWWQRTVFELAGLQFSGLSALLLFILVGAVILAIYDPDRYSWLVPITLLLFLLAVYFTQL